MKKHPLSSKSKTASALQLHILFFLLRGFLLLLIAALLLQKLHLLRDGVLRFGLLQGLGLLRCSAAIPPWQRQAVRLVLVAFCKRCLSCFPADFQILIMKRFVSCDRFGAMSTADAAHLHRVAGKASAGEVQLPLDD